MNVCAYLLDASLPARHNRSLRVLFTGRADQSQRIFEFIKRVFAWEAEQVAALSVGLLVGVLGLYTVYRILGRTLPWRDSETRRDLELAKASERHLHNLLSQRDTERDDLKTKIQELGGQCESLHEANADLVEVSQGLQETLAKKLTSGTNACMRPGRSLPCQRQQIEQFNNQMRLVTEQEGKFWERPPSEGIPNFRTFDKTRPPIIAVANLKGGVGKTTLTANLGATLWSRDSRVLLVDLDNQGSLTSLCLPPEELLDLKKGQGRFVHHLFQANSTPGETAWNIRTRIGDRKVICSLPGKNWPTSRNTSRRLGSCKTAAATCAMIRARPARCAYPGQFRRHSP